MKPEKLILLLLSLPFGYGRATVRIFIPWHFFFKDSAEFLRRVPKHCFRRRRSTFFAEASFSDLAADAAAVEVAFPMLGDDGSRAGLGPP